MGTPMRVAVLGNLANVGSLFVAFLNRFGIEADLIASSTDIAAIEEGRRRELKGHLIHHNRHWDSLLFGVLARLLPKGLASRICCLYRYDVIISMSSFNQYPVFIGRPFIALATGSDLREESYKRKGILYRCGFKKSRIVLSWLFDSRALGKLEMLRLAQFKFFRFPIDTEQYAPGLASIPEQQDFDFVLFSPTRNDWVDPGDARWKGGLKGNDKLIKGFARFLKETRDTMNPLLVLMETGGDIGQTKELVQALGIEANVTYRNYMSEEERIQTIQAADVVADHFCAGSFGGTFVEVLACGKPLIHYLEMDNINLAYPEAPPILNAFSEEEICERLLACADAKFRAQLGERARAWILRYHRWQDVTASLHHCLRLVHGRPAVYDVRS